MQYRVGRPSAFGETACGVWDRQETIDPGEETAAAAAAAAAVSGCQRLSAAVSERGGRAGGSCELSWERQGTSKVMMMTMTMTMTMIMS